MSNGWKSYFAVFFMLATSLSGCLNEYTSYKIPIIVEAGLPAGTFVTDSTGASIEIDPLEMEFYFSMSENKKIETRNQYLLPQTNKNHVIAPHRNWDH